MVISRFLGFIATVSLITPLSVQAELQNFQATYQLLFNGKLVGRSQFELKVQDNRYIFEALTLPAGSMSSEQRHEILEISRGNIDGHTLKPQQYDYALFDGDQIDPINMRFDWEESTVTIKNQKDEVETALPEKTQDRISYLLQTSLLATQGQAKQQLSITGLDNIAATEMLAQGHAILTLPYGRFEATAFKRESAGDNVNRLLWFAARLNAIPVQIDQSWPGGRSSMQLETLNWVNN